MCSTMPLLERDIERYLVRRTIEHGGVAYKWVSPGRVGVADRIVLLPGGVVWFVELKTVKGRCHRGRSCSLPRCAAGMNYIVIRSKEEVDQWFLTRSKKCLS
jgi:hypothetical protein